MRILAIFRRIPMPLLYLLGAWLLPGAVALGYLAYAAGASRLGLVMHLAQVYAVLVICLLPLTFPAFQSPPVALKRLLLAIPLASLQCVFLAFYASSLGSYFSWGVTPTWELIQVYLGQFNNLISQYKIEFVSSLILLSAAWLTLIWVYFRVIPSLQSSLGAASPSATSRTTTRWRTGMLLSLGLIISIYASNWWNWAIREPMHSMGRMQGEINFMVPDAMRTNHSPLLDARLAALPLHGKPASFRNLILITVDALRSDQMQVYGAPFQDTPFLASLYQAGKLKRIDSAYSVCTFSFCGMVGTQSSAYWHQLDGSSLVLADVLSHYGYQTRFILSGDHTHFYGIRDHFGSHIDEFRDGSSVASDQSNDDRIIIPWLRNIDWSPHQNTFLSIHLMSVHMLGPRQPEFQKWQPQFDSVRSLLSGISTTQTYRNHYLNGILEADHTIQQIFQILQEKGVLDQALVIITADHGEYLGEFGLTGHGRAPYQPVVHIPLLVYDQLAAAYPARSVSSQVDIAPTFLHAIGVPLPSEWSGIPLQLATARNAVSVASHDATGVVAEIAGRQYKYLLFPRNGREELFDLSASEAESDNLVSQPALQPVLKQLRRLHEEISHNHGPALSP